MADSLGLATDLVKGILSRAKELKTNKKECKLLARLAEKTLPLLETFHAKKLSDPSATKAVELVYEALEEANKVVGDCYNAAFFSALLHPESYSVHLKHAAGKLNRAVSQIPLVSLGMPTEVQSDMAALCERLFQAKSDEGDAIGYQINVLKKMLDRAFHQSIQQSDEVKKIVHELMQKHSSSNDEVRSELAKLQMNASQARMAKQRKQEFELNQIIAVLSESLGDDCEAPRVPQDLKECLRCPISKQVMRDPVTLKDSCMVYDRASISEYLRQGHRYDPLTNVELVSKDLVPNPALRDACQSLLKQAGVTLSTNDAPYQESSTQRIEPGLYEGTGNFDMGGSIICASQLLILGPNGVVVGCTLYAGEYFKTQEAYVEIGAGKWDSQTYDVCFGDTQFKYDGTVAFNTHNEERGIQWNGKVSKVDDLDKEHSFTLKYSPPPIAHEFHMHPTILELKGELPTTNDSVKYSSKLLLGLERDCTVNGWVSFESSCYEYHYTGRVLNGKWDRNGTLQFFIYVSLDDTPLNSESNPTNHEACFEVMGSIRLNEGSLCSTFNGTCHNKIEDQGMIGNKKAMSMPMECLEFAKYSLIREASTPWYFLNPHPLKLFQMSRNYDLRYSRYVDKASLHVRYGFIPFCQHTLGKSPLHLAAESNHVEIVKELIDEGNDINQFDNNGQSPLHVASFNNSLDALKELLRENAIVNIQDKLGKTPLHIAFEKRHTNIIKALIDDIAIIDLKDTRGWTMLHHASKNNHIDILKEIVAYGANVDLQSNLGQTALNIGSYYNHIEIVKELIANGASIDLQDEIGASPLLIASDFNFIDIVKELTSCGANVNLPTNSGFSPLYIASQKDHIDIIKELIANGANVDLHDKYGESPLHIAAQSGHTSIVKELIANGASVDLQRDNGASPLHGASEHNHIEIVKELLASGADIHLQMIDGASPLLIASQNGHINIVKELIVNGVNVNLQAINGVSPLFTSSQFSHINVVKELIANGASVDLQRDNGASSLHIASEKNHVTIVKELIASGADVDLQTNNGISSLVIAAQYGHIDIVNELIANSVNIDLQTNDGTSPLYVASQNNHKDVVKSLIANGANLNLQRYRGISPLHIASQNNHNDVAKQLIASGANVNLQDEDGDAPLHIASRKYHNDIVTELIANGANVDIQNGDGVSSMFIASQNNQIDIIKELIANGANIDLQDNDGFAPLHMASFKEHNDVIKELIACGANIDLRMNDGKTALHLASTIGRISVVKILLEHDASKKVVDEDGKTPYDVVCTVPSFGPYEKSIVRKLRKLLRT